MTPTNDLDEKSRQRGSWPQSGRMRFAALVLLVATPAFGQTSTAAVFADASTVPVSWLLGSFSAAIAVAAVLVKLWVGATERRIEGMVADIKSMVAIVGQHTTDLGRLMDRVERIERDVERLQNHHRRTGGE